MQDKEIYSYVNTKAYLEVNLKAKQRGIDSDVGRNWCYRDGAGTFHVTANQNEPAEFSQLSVSELAEGRLVITTTGGKLATTASVPSHSHDWDHVLHDIYLKGDPDGIAALDANGKIVLSQMPDTAMQKTHVVADEEERLALTDVIEGSRAFEASTKDTYIWDGSQWLVVSRADWENVNLDWSNIINPPSHNDLSGINASNCHPIDSITGLQSALDSKSDNHNHPYLSNSDPRIDDWDTAYSQTHTHSNKSYLDDINQNLSKSADPQFKELYVTRLGNTSQEYLHTYVEDTVCTQKYNNDEDAASLKWIIENTDTENSDGTDSNTTELNFYATKSVYRLTFKRDGVSHDFWHEGNFDPNDYSKITDLTSSYIPYWDGSQLANSPIWTDGDDVLNVKGIVEITNSHPNDSLILYNNDDFSILSKRSSLEFFANDQNNEKARWSGMAGGPDPDDNYVGGSIHFWVRSSAGHTTSDRLKIHKNGVNINGTLKINGEELSYNSIGAASSSHNHDNRYLKLTGGILTGTLKNTVHEQKEEDGYFSDYGSAYENMTFDAIRLGDNSSTNQTRSAIYMKSRKYGSSTTYATRLVQDGNRFGIYSGNGALGIKLGITNDLVRIYEPLTVDEDLYLDGNHEFTIRRHSSVWPSLRSGADGDMLINFGDGRHTRIFNGGAEEIAYFHADTKYSEFYGNVGIMTDPKSDSALTVNGKNQTHLARFYESDTNRLTFYGLSDCAVIYAYDEEDTAYKYLRLGKTNSEDAVNIYCNNGHMGIKTAPVSDYVLDVNGNAKIREKLKLPNANASNYCIELGSNQRISLYNNMMTMYADRSDGGGWKVSSHNANSDYRDDLIVNSTGDTEVKRNLNVDKNIETSDHFRTLSNPLPSFPTSGTGLELFYHPSGGGSFIESIDRDTDTHEPIMYRASQHYFTDGKVAAREGVQIGSSSAPKFADTRSISGTLGPSFRWADLPSGFTTTNTHVLSVRAKQVGPTDYYSLNPEGVDVVVRSGEIGYRCPDADHGDVEIIIVRVE